METPRSSDQSAASHAGVDRAVALRYAADSGRAPWVIASGRGALAQRLVDIATAHGVPVCEDPDLAALLAMVDLGDEIPAELFQAVADVIAFVYRANGALAGKPAAD